MQTAPRCAQPWANMFAVHYADETIAAINVALNEAEVYGFELSEDTAEARLLVSVSTLPPSGPIDPDGRRIVVLSNPSRVRVLLRSGPTATASPPIPLAGLDELDLFFDSLSWRDAMYGWPFMDGSVGVADEWPAPVSLDLELAEEVGEHSLYWFAKCGRNLADDIRSYFLQGLVWFDSLEVRRASGEPLALSDFTLDAHRWWDAFSERDPRVGIEAQRAAQRGPTWRSSQRPRNSGRLDAL